jgi:hypothetical protein
VLAELGRWAKFRGLRCRAEADRLPDNLNVAERRMPHASGNAQVTHLWLGEGLVDGVYRAAERARVVQQPHPVSARHAQSDSGNTLVERSTLSRTQFIRRMVRMR